MSVTPPKAVPSAAEDPVVPQTAAQVPADMVEWPTGPKGACFGPSGGAPKFWVSKLEVPAFLLWSGCPTATPRRVCTLLRRSLVALKRYTRHPGARGRWRAEDLSPAGGCPILAPQNYR